MNKPPRASIVFYDEVAGEFKICSVPRSNVEAQIERALVVPVLLESAEKTHAAITDEDARRLGSMIFIMQGYTSPELRDRFQFATANAMRWDKPLRALPFCGFV